MSGHEPLGGRPSVPGHQFQHVQVSDSARAHLGDTYNISRENPLGLLPIATNAPFNSYARQHEPICLPNTRVDVLQKISQWADGEDQQCLFWLSGMAGTGKSTIAHTVARRFFEQGRLAASFFFSRGGGDVGNASKFVATIAVQLAMHILPVQRHIRDILTERSTITSQSLVDQWRQLVLGPLLKLDGSDTYLSYLVVLDALDECEGENDVQIILRLLAEARSLKKVRLRVLITSRPEVPIRHGFCQIPNAEHRDFILHGIEAAIVDHDIFTFLDHEMGLIGQEWSLGASWPGEQALRRLVRIASGLFIWAATACRFIREGRYYAAKRLSMMLEGSTFTLAPDHHLNNVYMTVLKTTIHEEYLEEEKEDRYSVLKQVLGTIVLLYSPLSINSLLKLLHLPKGAIEGGLADLHAILDIPEDTSQPLRLHHPSFRDFLLDKDRCSDPKFWVDERQAHRMLANDCIRLMSESLKQNVCRQDAPGTLVADIESTQINKCLPSEVQYACIYWIQHLHKSSTELRDHDQVHQFLQLHLLHWLEALGWIRKTSEGILAILLLEAQISADKSPTLYAVVHDAKRFVLYNRTVIEQAPLQLYCSALVFAPENSFVRKQFEKCIPLWIQRKPKVQTNWNTTLQALEGHSSGVWSVAFSPDGKQVVSGSDDMTVRLWDAVTGTPLQTLKGHSSRVCSVAFSPDGKQVVSGSYDMTVRLWDAVTGTPLQTLKGHSSGVYSVAFSPDGKQVVSGSDDMTVRLWDAVTGTPLQTLKGHSSRVCSVAFSPDGKQVVSGSYDMTVRLWDAVTGTPLQTLKGHSSGVYSVAFSPDGKQVVSGSADMTVRLWDAVTGTPLQTLKGHSSGVWSVAFSPDGKQVVSGSDDMTVRLWDAVTGTPLQTLKGHSSYVNSVAFSPDGKQVVSGSADMTVRLWDAVTGTPLQTLKGHSSYVCSVAFSPDGKQVVSGSYDMTVRLWDAVTGTPLQTLKGHSSRVNSVAFSPDGKQVVSGSYDMTVRLWDAVTGTPLQTLKGHSSGVNSVAFSPDGKQVVSGSNDMTVRLWDAVTGTPLQTLKGHLDYVNSVAFSQDEKQLSTLLVSNDWVVEGGTKILWLPLDYRLPSCVAIWNKTLVLGYSSGKVSIIGFKEGLKVM